MTFLPCPRRSVLLRSHKLLFDFYVIPILPLISVGMSGAWLFLSRGEHRTKILLTKIFLTFLHY